MIGYEITAQVWSLGAVISVYCGFAKSKWYRIQHCTKQKTPSKSSQSLPPGSRIRPPNTYYVPVPMHSDCYYSIFCRKLSSRRYTKNPVCPLTNRMDSGIIKTKRAYRKRSAPTWEYGNSRLSLVARDGYFRLLKLRYARYARNTSQTMLMHLTRMSRFIRIHSLPGVGLTAVDLSVRSCC